MAARQLERGRHLPLLRALPHQRGVAARTERQREGVQQDRLAGAGLAGEHGKPVGEIDVEPIDQDDVADRKPDEHEVQTTDVIGRRIARQRDKPQFRPSVVRPLSLTATAPRIPGPFCGTPG